MPELTEQRLDPLPHAALKLSLLRHLSPRQQQQVTFFCQFLWQLFARVAQNAQHDAAIRHLSQLERRGAVIPVARRQHRRHDQASLLAQQVQLEAEKPAGTLVLLK